MDSFDQYQNGQAHMDACDLSEFFFPRPTLTREYVRQRRVGFMLEMLALEALDPPADPADPVHDALAQARSGLAPLVEISGAALPTGMDCHLPAVLRPSTTAQREQHRQQRRQQEGRRDG